jgi:dTDP-4-amino-4,6-dideoxygalactose transaminase
VNAVVRVIESGLWGRTTGKVVAQFEETFAKFQGARHGLAVINGTAGLRIALIAAGIREGDEVIVPPYTFLASATAVVESNAVPVFVDIDPETYNLDPGRIEAAITPRTRAIMPVHFAGRACDMERILTIARKHDLKVVEDACHGWGGRWKDKGLGCIGDLGVLSFQSSKNLTAGEGGFITTDDEDLLETRSRSTTAAGCVRAPVPTCPPVRGMSIICSGATIA